jgi:hypothetical protein
VNATLENYVFTATDFSNPVSVGPSATNVNFAAAATSFAAPAITSQPVGQTANPGANVTFTVTATGAAPFAVSMAF